jgi:pyruvate formate lyase activating enzyme
MDKMKQAMLWHKERNGVRCDLCARNCFVAKGKLGFCLVRKNVDNKLYTLNYGKLVAVNVDPVEKKPLFHFYPGSKALSIASAGCNFRCKFCCNWELSQVFADKDQEVVGKEYSPEDIVKLAEKNNCKSISYTYTEPTIFFEFAYDTAKLAHKNNIKNTFVTNGYMTPDGVKKIAKYLDAATVDFKASGDPGFYKNFMGVPKVDPIFKCLRQMKKQRIFIEITNLIVPQLGDSVDALRKLANQVVSKFGSDTPFHLIRFHPSYKLLELPATPIATLERLAEEARKTGLRHVYIGNVPGHEYENTYCYNCRELLIERKGFLMKKINLVGDRCPNCGVRINMVTE